MTTDTTNDALQAHLDRLQEENARLKALLAAHDIPWESAPPAPSPCALPRTDVAPAPVQQFSPAEKIAIFRRLFRGRVDVFPVRWESAKSGKAGYAPACGNEWKRGVCNKPKGKCAVCDNRRLLPVTEQTIYNHLAGAHTIGVYPMLADDTCYFLAVDFDKAEWKEDATAFMQSCRELDVPAALEISRSGNGAHVWIFFSEPVTARDARSLGASLLSHTCARTRQLSLASYDRLFPNQDTLPKGGFGNLIALPLQKKPREHGGSVFVREDFTPYPDQWAFLAALMRMNRGELESAIFCASGGRHPLDVAFVEEEDERTPWRRPAPVSNVIPGPLPESLRLVLANQLFIAKEGLPQPLMNRLVRLAAFQNPEFYKAQAMRMPVWDKPRIIGCAENFPQHIGLPRGCLAVVLELLEQNDIRVEIQDERVGGAKIAVKFTGTLRADQKTAVKEILKSDIGVLSAPTAFGKTVVAAALIAKRKVSALILVHRTELLRQWQERLATFLDLPTGTPGAIGGGKNTPSGHIDIAVMQSLSRRDDLGVLLDNYGHILVDECHHLSAFSFEAILKQAKAKYVIGLTATPIRRDGHQPIIFMQCGPIRHSATKPESAPGQLEVWSQSLDPPEIPVESPIQDVFRILVNDAKRNLRITHDIVSAYGEGRKVLVLTERTEHLHFLHEALGGSIEHLFVLHGRLSGKQRATVYAALDALGDTSPRVLLATGRLIGEGFDHPPLDTLVLAMPISWKGTLQQYAGRLHREHASKKDVRIYDYVEHEHPQLARMWDKRLRGYRAMGYVVHAHE